MATVQIIPFPESLQSTLQRFAIHLYAKCGSAETTVELLTGFIRRAAPEIGTHPTHNQVERYIAQMRQSGISYSMVASAINAFTHYMQFLGDPIVLKRPRKPKAILGSTLSEAEIAIIINAAPTIRERAILTLLAYSGLRNRELCALWIRNVDLPNQMIGVKPPRANPSGRSASPAPARSCSSSTCASAPALPDDRLFVTVRHRHMLAPRHSLATNMLHRGANLLTIKDQLGHAFIDTTMIYLHSSRERLQAEYRAFAPSYL